jgi:hypothetical protein
MYILTMTHAVLLQQPRQVPFAVYTHRPVNSAKFLWYECYNNDIDPQGYLEYINRLNVIQTGSTSLHLGYIDAVDDSITLSVNLYGLDTIATRATLWLNAERLVRLELGYTMLMDMLEHRL